MIQSSIKLGFDSTWRNPPLPAETKSCVAIGNHHINVSIATKNDGYFHGVTK